jgi:hypothetical protein
MDPAGEKAEPLSNAGSCPTSPRNFIFDLDRTTTRDPEGGTSHRPSTCPTSRSGSITELNAATRDLGGEKVPHAFTNDISGGIAQHSPSSIVTSQPSPNPFPEFSPHLASSIPAYPPRENKMLAELKTFTNECCHCLCCGKRAMIFGWFIGDTIPDFLECGCCLCLHAASGGRWELPLWWFDWWWC